MKERALSKRSAIDRYAEIIEYLRQKKEGKGRKEKRQKEIRARTYIGRRAVSTARALIDTVSIMVIISCYEMET